MYSYPFSKIFYFNAATSEACCSGRSDPKLPGIDAGSLQSVQAAPSGTVLCASPQERQTGQTAYQRHCTIKSEVRAQAYTHPAEKGGLEG